MVIPDVSQHRAAQQRQDVGSLGREKLSRRRQDTERERHKGGERNGISE